jgi:regulatory protein
VSRCRRWISPVSNAAPLDIALRFLAQRPRSAHEVRQRLRRAGVDEDAADQVLRTLERHGLVDDAAFANYWVDQRRTFRPRGARLVRAELRQHGVSSAIAETSTQAIEPAAEDDAYRAAHRRARTLATTDERTFKHRLSQFLIRRGFDWGTINTVVERLTAERA